MHIKVGLLFSLTGTTSLTEKGQFDAALFATEQFKEAGYDVEVMTEDIASDPYRAKECAEKLAQQGVKIFIGCYTSACRKAIRSEEHTSELQSRFDLVCRLLLE